MATSLCLSSPHGHTLEEVMQPAFAKQFHACSKMPTLGFEPRLPQPQRDVLTTRRCGPCFSALNRRTSGQAFSSNSNSGIFCHLPFLPLPSPKPLPLPSQEARATAARLTPDQKVGSLSGLIFLPAKTTPKALSMASDTSAPKHTRQQWREDMFTHSFAAQALFRHRDSNPGRSDESRVS